MLAWRKNLRKTRPTMYRSSPRRHRARSGPATRTGFLLAVTLGFSIACSSDDDPADGGLGGGGSINLPDASLPPLPGDGREPTPESDISDRQIESLPSDDFIQGVIDVREDVNPEPGHSGSSGADAAAPDAGADAAVDGAP